MPVQRALNWRLSHCLTSIRLETSRAPRRHVVLLSQSLGINCGSSSERWWFDSPAVTPGRLALPDPSNRVWVAQPIKASIWPAARIAWWDSSDSTMVFYLT